MNVLTLRSHQLTTGLLLFFVFIATTLLTQFIYNADYAERTFSSIPFSNYFLRRNLSFVNKLNNKRLMETQEDKSNTNNDKTNDETQKTKKPLMHTFFEHIPKNHKKGTTGKNEGSGMSDEGHAALLSAWEKAWTDAGWETRILDLNDAKAHPDYEKVRTYLDNGNFGMYDILCFLRWFAMVSAGGGWMCDYDVFPLKGNIPKEIMGEMAYGSGSSKSDTQTSVPLPNSGKFTAYDNGGLVPSLISASKEEWDRLAHGIMDMAYIHDMGFYSDMLALDDYEAVHHPNAFVKEYSVLWRLADVLEREGAVKCNSVWAAKTPDRGHHFWAVHFSHWNIHDALEQGVLREGLGRDDRAEIATDFLREWDEQCESSQP